LYTFVDLVVGLRLRVGYVTRLVTWFRYVTHAFTFPVWLRCVGWFGYVYVYVYAFGYARCGWLPRLRLPVVRYARLFTRCTRCVVTRTFPFVGYVALLPRCTLLVALRCLRLHVYLRTVTRLFTLLLFGLLPTFDLIARLRCYFGYVCGLVTFGYVWLLRLRLRYGCVPLRLYGCYVAVYVYRLLRLRCPVTLRLVTRWLRLRLPLLLLRYRCPGCLVTRLVGYVALVCGCCYPRSFTVTLPRLVILLRLRLRLPVAAHTVVTHTFGWLRWLFGYTRLRLPTRLHLRVAGLFPVTRLVVWLPFGYGLRLLRLLVGLVTHDTRLVTVPVCAGLILRSGCC